MVPDKRYVCFVGWLNFVKHSALVVNNEIPLVLTLRRSLRESYLSLSKGLSTNTMKTFLLAKISEIHLKH